MGPEVFARYSRHIFLPQFGEAGQESMMAASVLIIGCGGLGSVTAPLLAAAGTGSITLADPDRVEVSNLQRQVHYREEDVGKLKVNVLARHIRQQNSHISLRELPEKLDYDALLPLCESHDVVVDCSDNFATRHAVNAACVHRRKTLVFGSAIKFDGQLCVFNCQEPTSPCYACLFPSAHDLTDSCGFSGVFSPLVGLIGALQAGEAIKAIIRIPELIFGQLYHFDMLDLRGYGIKVGRDPRCRVCGARQSLSKPCSKA